MKVEGQLNESFVIRVGVRQGCVMLPWLSNIFMDSCMKEIESKVGHIGARLWLNGVGWSVLTCLFVDDSVLFIESVRELQRAVDEFYYAYLGRNIGKNSVMVFEEGGRSV